MAYDKEYKMSIKIAGSADKMMKDPTLQQIQPGAFFGTRIQSGDFVYTLSSRDQIQMQYTARDQASAAQSHAGIRSHSPSTSDFSPASPPKRRRSNTRQCDLRPQYRYLKAKTKPKNVGLFGSSDSNIYYRGHHGEGSKITNE